MTSFFMKIHYWIFTSFLAKGARIKILGWKGLRQQRLQFEGGNGVVQLPALNNKSLSFKVLLLHMKR